jgi:hypothetical protein
MIILDMFPHVSWRVTYEKHIHKQDQSCRIKLRGILDEWEGGDSD